MYQIYEYMNSMITTFQKSCETIREASDYADKLQRDWNWQGQKRHFCVTYKGSIIYNN